MYGALLYVFDSLPSLPPLFQEGPAQVALKIPKHRVQLVSGKQNKKTKSCQGSSGPLPISMGSQLRKDPLYGDGVVFTGSWYTINYYNYTSTK
jgi:hypothetical protein